MIQKQESNMKKSFFIILFFLSTIRLDDLSASIGAEKQLPHYEWAVIGAGFAGITALAVLLDAGVEPTTVAWIDPEFNVGSVGKYYREVPGNIQTKHLIEYVQNCPYFKDISSAALDQLYTYPAEQFQHLHVIVDPLLDFTACLQNMVVPIQTNISSLRRVDDTWILENADGGMIQARKAILAIGAHPRRLNYNIPEISLGNAFNRSTLEKYVSAEDCIGVFGGMHSALLVLKNLCECCCVKQIINFYMEDYFYGSPGLEGATAEWAENILEKQPPVNLIRAVNNEENRNELLHLCTKAIYAIGYEANKIMVNGSSQVTFDEYTGIIDEDLYGIGIAFPPTGIFNGQKIAKNGLHAYLVYAKKLIPRWVNGEKAHFVEDDRIEIPWI